MLGFYTKDGVQRVAVSDNEKECGEEDEDEAYIVQEEARDSAPIASASSSACVGGDARGRERLRDGDRRETQPIVGRPRRRLSPGSCASDASPPRARVRLWHKGVPLNSASVRPARADPAGSVAASRSSHTPKNQAFDHSRIGRRIPRLQTKRLRMWLRRRRKAHHATHPATLAPQPR